ncbi:restriction endonuclease subunit S [Enterococcus sp. SMC-9]|uniref:restriction endonuclease subunit S n=1 Tax=Enterococcus sp. SMC-9 TaxID=2862343 RepID=UPI001E6453C0|nr:restriction endonuclease subunit S [Enterococcus sp. SMC-9]MCD1025463.1 restriction endonuclease subunit S [Enterococcus sp. SMC-9]
MPENKPAIRFKGFENDWEQRKLGDIVTRVTRKNTNLESTRPLTISAQFGLVDQNTFFNKQIASKDVSGYYLLEKGEFAYNKSYSNGYPWGAIKRLDKYDMGVLSTLYICFKPVDINSDFLASYYDTNRWYKEVSKHAAEGARNHGLLNIAASDFFETELVVPANQNEQEQLANFFKTLDNTITLHQQQLENLKKTKKAYLQKMFPKNNEKVPEIRFEGFADDWEQRKLGDIVTRVTRKNTNLESTRPLTISAQFGLVDQNTFFNKQIASKDVSGYYLLEKGEFAYNKSYSNGYPWGAIKRLDKYDMGVLSTLYICFKPVDINSDFLASYYDTNRWYKEVSKHAAEGARNHGLLNIAASDFFETELVVPANQNEQEQLANFFKTLDNTITLHQRKLDYLKEMKKGLLQKMFV